jgi:hypothetical protein
MLPSSVLLLLLLTPGSAIATPASRAWEVRAPSRLMVEYRPWLTSGGQPPVISNPKPRFSFVSDVRLFHGTRTSWQPVSGIHVIAPQTSVHLISGAV